MKKKILEGGRGNTKQSSLDFTARTVNSLSQQWLYGGWEGGWGGRGKGNRCVHVDVSGMHACNAFGSNVHI